MSGSTIKAEATLSQRVALFFLGPIFPWLAALCTTLLVACTLDVADECDWSITGPGLTFDEAFNIEVGVYLVRSFAAYGTSAFHPQTMQEIYSDPAYNADHPPLGRIALGIAELNAPQSRIKDAHYFVTGARLASAVEFGLLVLLVSFYTRRWFGPFRSFAATIALICMPRMVGHAHLASLEMCTCMTYSTFLFVLADSWWKRERLKIKHAFLPGVLLGLALLTKIHAVLLLPVILVWGLFNWRLRSVIPMLAIILTGGVVFFIGWPWLWSDPLAHLTEYFARTTDRVSLNCYYLGQKFADKDVPWHYPFVMFAITMPAGFLLIGLWGMLKRTGNENSRSALFDRRSQLLFGAWLLPLIVFALPSVTVYDGVRLFLMCFPLFAVFVGLGAGRVYLYLLQRERMKTCLVLTLLACGGPIFSMIFLHPCHLSYYNAAVGGLRGAEKLGFETSYWGDAVTAEMLSKAAEQIPQNSTLEVAPVLHPLQLEFMRQGTWLRHRPDITLSAYDDNRDDLSPYVLVIRRHADPWNSLSPPPTGTQTLSHTKREGVVLAEVVKLPYSTISAESD